MKKILSILMVGLLSIGLVACFSKEDTARRGEDHNKSEVESIRKLDTRNEGKREPIEAFKEELKKNGLTIGENSEGFNDMVGATSRQKFKVNDEVIEVYYYDENELTEQGKKLFEQAQRGNINISEVNLSVIYKDNFALARISEHKNKDKILEVFSSFNYKRNKEA